MNLKWLRKQNNNYVGHFSLSGSWKKECFRNFVTWKSFCKDLNALLKWQNSWMRILEKMKGLLDSKVCIWVRGQNLQLMGLEPSILHHKTFNNKKNQTLEIQWKFNDTTFVQTQLLVNWKKLFNNYELILPSKFHSTSLWFIDLMDYSSNILVQQQQSLLLFGFIVWACSA